MDFNKRSPYGASLSYITGNSTTIHYSTFTKTYIFFYLTFRDSYIWVYIIFGEICSVGPQPMSFVEI